MLLVNVFKLMNRLLYTKKYDLSMDKKKKTAEFSAVERG